MDNQRTPSQLSTPLLVRVEEAARILSLGRATIYKMIDSGQLPSIKCGAARRIPVAAIEKWIAANTQQHSLPSDEGAENDQR
jgi:excisionase family DNA binding protein